MSETLPKILRLSFERDSRSGDGWRLVGVQQFEVAGDRKGGVDVTPSWSPWVMAVTAFLVSSDLCRRRGCAEPVAIRGSTASALADAARHGKWRGGFVPALDLSESDRVTLNARWGVELLVDGDRLADDAVQEEIGHSIAERLASRSDDSGPAGLGHTLTRHKHLAPVVLEDELRGMAAALGHVRAGKLHALLWILDQHPDIVDPYARRSKQTVKDLRSRLAKASAAKNLYPVGTKLEARLVSPSGDLLEILPDVERRRAEGATVGLALWRALEQTTRRAHKSSKETRADDRWTALLRKSGLLEALLGETG